MSLRSHAYRRLAALRSRRAETPSPPPRRRVGLSVLRGRELALIRTEEQGRLILLKRRLAERGAPIHIEKTRRGRFRLDIVANLRLESIDATG